MRDVSVFPIPPRLARLPRDPRGYPITYTVFKLPDGTLDFTTSDATRWQLAYQNKLCGLCGMPLSQNTWWIGGPKCMAFRYFWDHPMHEECARYALVVCPYIALPRYLGAKSRPTPEAIRVPIRSSNSTKPDCFGLARGGGYKLVAYQGDTLLHVTNEWKYIEWWKDGQQLA